MSPRATSASSRPSLAGRVVTAALYLVWTALIVAAPLAAAWVASSVAAHAGGSTRVAAALGLLVFPVLPVAWELVGTWRRARQAAPRRRFLTLLDRLVLRTLAVSVLFLGALLAREHKRVFEAVNARGDWMLDGRHDATSETARRGIFWVAARARWIDRALDDNPFHGHTPPRPQPLPTATQVRVEPTETQPAARVEPPPPEVAPEPPRDPHAWPWAKAMHASVGAMTAADEASPESVGRYLAAQTRDPWMLAKAVHDYVSDRVAYDVDAYRSGQYPLQDAATTFRTRRSVCAGYAALYEAIGRAAGLTVETVVGRARGVVAEGMGEGHAWNAVKLDARWYLVDTTWDAGYVDTSGFHKRYDTAYFLTPPEIFFAKHFPDEARWQLMEPARTEGEYLRQPAMGPEFFAQGLRLRSPDRAETDAGEVAEVVVENPRGASLLASAGAPGGATHPCAVTGDRVVTVRCTLDAAGPNEVTLFAAAQRYTMHWSVGTLRFVRR